MKKHLWYIIPLLLLMITVILNRLGYLKKMIGFSLREIVNKALKPEQELFISQLAPSAQPIFREFIRRVEALGYSVIITSAVRTFKNQAGQGGDNARVGYSTHEYGLATDINLQKGTSYWRKSTPKSEWEATGVPAIARSLGMRWGGDFQSYKGGDEVHFDLKDKYDINTLRARAINYYGTNLASIDENGVKFVS